VTAPDTPITIDALRRRKNATPIVALTAYSASMARLLDDHADLLLVGDSLAMVIYGMDTTLCVGLDTMIGHGRAVAQSTHRACVCVDLPFGSYQESPRQAFRNAARVLAETGASAVKLEGGVEMAETVAFLSERGVPVLGHVGMMPQSVRAYGGFRTRGRDDAEAEAILADAHAVADAGAFALVVEGVVESLARRVTEAVAVPTIGIGASPACDGQILVIDDLLGLSDGRKPKFVKRYADLASAAEKAVAAYAEDVRARRFPDAAHCYGVAAKD
jgi:3-methyl-2-oxobutanoate hydroxymethyltransferase